MDPAESYPNRTVVVVVPWAAGGGTDRVARFLADQLQRELGQPVVVQNQTGGSGASGHAAGARALPDGYTITMGTFELSTMRAMGISDLTYRDFQPLMQVNADPAALIVRQDAPWMSLGDLLDAVRSNPGSFKMSGTAAGGAWDLARAGLLLAAELPVDAVRWVPSQGSAPSLVELLGGHIDVVCCSVAEAASQLEAGQLRVLCVMSRERLPDYPDVPTAGEAGVDWEAVGWRGLLLPKRTPDPIRDKLVQTLTKIVESEAYRDFMQKNGFAIAVRGPDAFGEFLAQSEAEWAKVIAAAGYAPDPGGTGGPPTLAAGADPGPWFFPSVLAIGLILGVIGIVGRAVLRGSKYDAASLPLETADREVNRNANIVWLLLSLACYLVALPWLGFFISTGLYATLLMVWLGMRWLSAFALTVVMLAAVHLLFVELFHVVLPQSPWNLPI